MATSQKFSKLSDEELATEKAKLLEANVAVTAKREASEAKFRAEHAAIRASLDQIDAVERARKVAAGMSEEQRLEMAEVLKAGV
jgi:hypothetical protein